MPPKRWLLYGIGTLLLLGIWQILSLFYPPVLVPSPGETLLALASLARSGVLVRQVGISLSRIAVAFGVSVLAGASLGLLAGLRPSLQALLQPALDLAMSAPTISWLVLVLVWFGTGSATPIVTVIIVATPVVFANVFAGVCAVDGDLVGMARLYGARGRTLLLDLYLPALGPHVFAGLSIAISLAVRVGVMGELLGSDSGVGNALATARIYLETPQVFAWVLVTVGLLLVLDGLILRPAQRWAEAWRRQA